MANQQIIVGLDLGGTNIKSGVGLRDSTIIWESVQPTDATASPEKILNDLAIAAQQALKVAKQQNGNPIAIGVGTPGSVDVQNGFLKGGTPNFKSWKNVPIKAELEKILQLPVYVDNDANMMAYGEFRFGAGRGKNKIVTITLGTGIGGGIVLDGKLFRGHNCAGSEIGHMSICYNGKKCRCGGTGCWEVYASATAMLENFRQWSDGREVTNTKEIFQLYHDGDAVARRVVEQEIEMVAVGTASVINIFNPEIFIIGGGVSEAGDWFIEKIRERVKDYAMPEALKGVQIVRAQLGNRAGWLGAAIFALEEQLILQKNEVKE